MCACDRCAARTAEHAVFDALTVAGRVEPMSCAACDALAERTGKSDGRTVVL